MTHHLTVLIRLDGQTLELGSIPLASDASPTAFTVADALDLMADRIRLWRRFRDVVGEVA